MPRLDYKRITVRLLPLALLMGGVAWGLGSCAGDARAARNGEQAAAWLPDSTAIQADSTGAVALSIPQPKTEVRYFVLPEPPAQCRGTRDHKNFMVQNFWNEFDFRNTGYIGNEKITEAAFEVYCDLLRMADAPKARQSIHMTLARAHGEPTGAMYVYFKELFEKHSPKYYDEIKLTLLH